MNRTKIICTIGPASRDPKILRALMDAGMNVCRLNFSHGTQDEHAALIKDIRRVATEAKRHVAILQDLAGPKIRTGPVACGAITLKEGAAFRLTNRDVPGDAVEVGLTYPELPGTVEAGDTLMLADGLMELVVESTDGTDVDCRVVMGGELGSHKGINLPGRSLKAPILSAKDRSDLEFGLAQDVDYIALSFVRGAADVAAVNEIIAAAGKDTPVIAKIEKFEALDHIDEIIAAAGGIMVARGDLGVEIPIAQIAIVQKQLIWKANRLGKPVITATQMLESMTTNRRPTRAEATDVANAVLDGTDAVMLSGESAMGQFPVDAAEMLATIAANIEPLRTVFPVREELSASDRDKDVSLPDLIARSVVTTSQRITPAAVIVPTHSGTTARRITRFRLPVWITAVSSYEKTCQDLLFSYGVFPVCEPEHPTDWRSWIRNWLKVQELSGELVVMTEGPSRKHPERNNRMEIVDLKKS